MCSVIRYSSEEIVWQEVPGETSLAYTVTGCPVGCKGCHSVDTWPVGSGIELSPGRFAQRLYDYQGLITCVLFLGGEWHHEELLVMLKIARGQGLKTCLYTGLERIPAEIEKQLDYLKTGPWVARRGGLESRSTNQRFMNVKSGELLNVHFWD